MTEFVVLMGIVVSFSAILALALSFQWGMGGLVSELATLVIPPNYRIGIPLCVIALILIFRPQGIFGTVYIRR